MKQKNKQDVLSVFKKGYGYFDNKKCAKQRATKGFCYRDLYDVGGWFLHIMPKIICELLDLGEMLGYPTKMRREFYQLNMDRIFVGEDEFVFCCPNKYQDIDAEAAQWCFEKWTKTLERMQFLFEECQDDKCSMKNEFEQDYCKASKEFCEKYGIFGERFGVPKNCENENEASFHSMAEAAEYKDIYDKFCQRSNEICEYQKNCKQEALQLFVEYFDDLWC